MLCSMKNIFRQIISDMLNKHVAFHEKYISTNETPCKIKELYKNIMARTRIPKKFKKKQGGSQIDYPIEKTTLKNTSLIRVNCL